MKRVLLVILCIPLLPLVLVITILTVLGVSLYKASEGVLELMGVLK